MGTSWYSDKAENKFDFCRKNIPLEWCGLSSDPA
jgi:hypothetical protein